MGAFSNEGLFWISPKGKIIPVNVPPYQNYSSHEEYAQEKWNVSLETALEKRYIRIQSIENSYLFIDHEQKILANPQIKSLETFFYGKSYNNILVERINNDMKEFTRNQMKSALAFAIDGSSVDDEEEVGQTMSAKGQAMYARQKDVSSLHPYYQGKSSPLGDSIIDFKQWLILRESN